VRAVCSLYGIIIITMSDALDDLFGELDAAKPKAISNSNDPISKKMRLDEENVDESTLDNSNE
jgi:hypothetical protein